MTDVNFAIITLLNGILGGACLAVVMGTFLKLSRRLNSATRFTVLWLTLIAVISLPFVTLVLRVIPRATLASSSSIAMTNKPSATAAAQIDDQNLNVKAQLHKSNSTMQSVSVRNYNVELTSEGTHDSGKTEGYISQLRSILNTVLEHPVIRIHSGRLLSSFEILWALLSSVMLLRLGFGYRGLRRLKADTKPMPTPLMLRLRSLGTFNGVNRHAHFLVSSRVATPMSLGFLNPAILIPQTLLDTLSDSELENVVLHELGHLHRRDDWTNLAEKVIEAMLPIQPAVFWLGRQLSIEREMACDDWVLTASGKAESYAASLTKVAELSDWAQAGILAAGATGNRSQLFSRVKHILDKTRNGAPRVRIVPLSAAIVAIGSLFYICALAPEVITLARTSAIQDRPQVFATPGPLRIPAAPPALIIGSASGKSQTAPASATTAAAFASITPVDPPAVLAESVAAPVTQQNSETHMEMTTRNGQTSLSLKIDGAVEFTDDDHDIKSLSAGGRFRLEEGSLLSGRSYEVKADSAGTLTKTYSMGWSTRTLDAEGRAWLAGLLPQMIRDSGIAAESRVARILRQGGAQAVFDEIRLIHTDGSKRTYLEQLFSQAPLDTDQLRETAKLTRGISSDGDKAQVIVAVDSKYFNRELRPDLFETIESINSDGDKRTVLSDLLTKDGGSPDTQLGVARTVKHISSDGDKAEVLIEMASPYRESGGIGPAYFEAVKTISSDGDHARVLTTLLTAHGDDRDTLARVLGSAEKISSDGDKARVLKEAVSRYSDDELTRKVFIGAANSISSDGDHQQVLVTLAHRQGIGSATIGEIAKSAQRISSDGDKARVLLELVSADVDPVRDNFIAAADSIHSDGDHSRVLLAVLDKPGTTSSMAIAAIQSATHISADGDAGNVLMDAARKFSKDPNVLAALRKAVEKLHSDGTYRSVMSEIARRDQGN